MSLAILVYSVSASQPLTQTEAVDCPVISVTCPAEDPGVDSPITFSVTVTGGKSIEPLSYCWRVSRGKIKKGQGTPSIEVEAEEADREGLTATVDVSGFDPKCAHVASCSTMIRAKHSLR
jgi:hypothetical protein